MKTKLHDLSFTGKMVPLELKKEEHLGGVRFQLYVAKDMHPYMKGEPWATINIQASGLEKGQFALNHDFVNCCSLQLVMDVVDALAVSTEPECFTTLGFPVYRMKEEVMAW